jgi:hypothetical protein
MWTKITFLEAIRYGEGKGVLLKPQDAYINVADAKGFVLHMDDGSRLGAVSRFQAKPYDVDDDPVDGETEPIVWPLTPAFYVWEE